ncbi:MAG TPA: hypothetical protein VF753_00415 [Terriglobales bacterium]
MSKERKSALISISGTAYAALLYCYPRDFRQKFATEIADVFESLLRDAITERGLAGMVSSWRFALWELFTVAAPLRLASSPVMAGAIALLASFALVLSFFRAVT